MNCAEYQDWVAADVDGLADTPREGVRRHLEGCVSCRALRARTVAVRSLLRSRSLGHDAPVGLRTRIRAHIEEESGRARDVRWRVVRWPRQPFAAVAALVVLSAAAFLLFGRGEPRGLALEDYRLALSGALPPTVRTSAPADLESFYARRASPLPSHVVDLSQAGFRLRGAILRSDGEQPLRLSVYDDGVHVVVCDFRELGSFPGPTPGEDEALFVSREGLNLCVRRMGGHVCVLATRMPMDLFKARMAVYVTG